MVAVGSILSLTLLVLVGSKGLSEAFARVPPKYNNALVGFVIAAVGAYVPYAGQTKHELLQEPHQEDIILTVRTVSANCYVFHRTPVLQG